MRNRLNNLERCDMEDRFITIARPSKAEGVGRALQAAYRDGYDLPAEMRAYLDRLDEIRR
jgi:hypothetical protein